MGPTLAFSDRLHAEKYRLPNEDFRESVNRVASVLKDDEAHFRKIRDILLDMRFAPAGRIQAAIGSPKIVTAFNCFASGRIEDSFTDGEGSIMRRATEAAETMRKSGGIGSGFSNLRPEGALIKTLGSRSSGPIPFIGIFNAVGQCVSSAGHRRGAQMGTLRIDHPDIERFILAKQNTDALTGFNISVSVTDEFMESLESGKPFPLRFEGRVYQEVDPKALWEMLMRSTWDWAEPGVLFIDTINRMNNLWYCEEIETTNPCGEQPLPPFGACLLGSFNLVKYLRPRTGGGWDFDFDQFARDVPLIVRMMDNVIDNTIYPLEAQRKESLAKRRMGLGIMGLANAAEACGYPYGSAEFVDFERQVLDALRVESYAASSALAAEKGAFPMFDRDKYLQGEFIKALPEKLQDRVYRYGIRNSHLTSIAPTGTISWCADNVSSGVEPVFDYEYDRFVNMPEGQISVKVDDYGFRELGVRGKRAKDVTIREHVDVLAAAAALVDSSVSKTCNVDGSMPWEAFGGVYKEAWKRGCKGCTTYNADGKRGGILVADENPKAEACYIDDATGRRECS